MALLGGASALGASGVPDARRVAAIRTTAASPDIVVIGAGAWGSWTALHLRKMGAKVTVVDSYGAGNSRSTSGDETRGVRSSYGDKPGQLGELWMLWAREAMKRWIAFDDEWGKELRLNLFHVTGDLIFRQEWDNFQLRTKVWWDKNKIPYQILKPEDVRKAFPVISIDDITAITLRAGRRSGSSPPRVPERGRGLREAGRQDRHRPRVAIKDLEWQAGGNLARYGRNAPRRHLCLLRRPMARENLS